MKFDTQNQQLSRKVIKNLDLNIGHSIECGWFLIKEAKRTDNPELKDKAIKHFIDYPLEYGLDVEHGGLFYFLDVDGNITHFVV